MAGLHRATDSRRGRISITRASPMEQARAMPSSLPSKLWMSMARPQTVRRRLVCVGIRFFTCKHFLGEKYAAPVWCPVASHCSVLLVILSLPTTRVQPRWRRLLPPKPLQEPAVLPKGEFQTSPIRTAGNRFRGSSACSPRIDHRTAASKPVGGVTPNPLTNTKHQVRRMATGQQGG